VNKNASLTQGAKLAVTMKYGKAETAAKEKK
jgi:hypothetical protein